MSTSSSLFFFFLYNSHYFYIKKQASKEIDGNKKERERETLREINKEKKNNYVDIHTLPDMEKRGRLFPMKQLHMKTPSPIGTAS